MKTMRRILSATLIAVCLPVLGACTPALPQVTGVPSDGVRLEPASGAYFGVNLDWQVDSPAEFNQRLGRRAAVYVRFFRFPLVDSDILVLESTVTAVAQEGAMLLITLEPLEGLASVTAQTAGDFAALLAQANSRGVPVFVRFAHEMNGSWYPWSQQPAAYIDAFHIIADAVHSQAPASAMIWSPNYGGGYPFAGGPFEALPGSADFAVLDTNSDDQLSMADDPYAPYYPGDDAVDWVGISLYHWGSAYPWGENEMPEPGKFMAQLRGEYAGLNGDDTDIPDFYATYWTGRGKPVAIPETAAFFDPTKSGPGELALKQAWWNQVLDPAFLAAHPGIKMVNWFEWIKPELEVGGAIVDWRALGSSSIGDQFRQDLPVDRLIFAR